MVALWIKEQSRGQTKIVIVGRPRRWLSRFNLIIAAAHHHVPHLPNVMRLGLPLIKADAVGIADARARWSRRDCAKLPRPLFALFVGGPTKPHVFDREVALDLMARASRCAAEAGGSLWVTTSPRTSARRRRCNRRGAAEERSTVSLARRTSPDNPYLGLLACADRFIVTGDSVSMQVEVARLGKPLAIYRCRSSTDSSNGCAARSRVIAYGRTRHRCCRGSSGRCSGSASVKFPRDVAEIHALLFEQGFAVRLGEPFASARQRRRRRSRSDRRSDPKPLPTHRR